WDLLERIGDARFAMVILRAGDLAVEEWIDGSPLDARPPRPEHLASAAAFLAALHRVCIDGIGAGRVVATATMRDAACSHLEDLRRHALLAGETERHLTNTVRHLAPAAATTGITHNDLCGENLVVDASGTLRIVDNENVAPGFVDFDLARTWY